MSIYDTIKRVLFVDRNSATSATSAAAGLRRATSASDGQRPQVARLGLVPADTFDTRDYIAPSNVFSEVATAYNVDSYVRQAVDFYVKYMFKNGWDLVSKDKAAADYIKARLSIIEDATKIPTHVLFLEVAEDLVKYANAILAKARDPEFKFPPKLRVKAIDPRGPVVGYFPLNIMEMSVKRDKHGTIKGWQQTPQGSEDKVRFRPEDIVHFYYMREKGQPFATPFIVPAISDVKALRQAEENVLRLIFRNIFPFLHYKVGTPDVPGDENEVEEVRAMVQSMDIEGGLVTTERHSITPIATNQVINAAEYLKYFERRVFTALGVSELLMGRADTANRSTGDNLSSNFVDSVKSFQRVMETFIDLFIIKELLLEGGIDVLVEPDRMVNFRFKEIDTDLLVKRENHAVFLYEHNAITEDEMRRDIGRDAIEDRSGLYMYKVTIPLSQAKAEAPSTADTDNRNEPTNKPRKVGPNESMRSTINIEDLFDFSLLVSLSGSFNSDWRDRFKQQFESVKLTVTSMVPSDKSSDIAAMFDSMLDVCFHAETPDELSNVLWLFGKSIQAYLNQESR